MFSGRRIPHAAVATILGLAATSIYRDGLPVRGRLPAAPDRPEGRKLDALKAGKGRL